ncbi:MAG: YfiT family bacillithiol transferase [Aureispira sp.]
MQEQNKEAVLHQLKFPIGVFVFDEKGANEQISQWITTISTFPKAIIDWTEGLTVEQKNWKYRPQGWAIKQVVHHCADSHMNSLIRFKLSLTEKEPTIRPYYENRWAMLVDSQNDNLEDSILLLTGLHNKWTNLLRALTAEDLEKGFVHPEHNKRFTLKEALALYAWHCQHHLAHIKQAIDAAGKYN